MLLAAYGFLILEKEKLRLELRIRMYLSHIIIVVMLHFVSITVSRFGQNSLIWIAVRDGYIVLDSIIRELNGSLTVNTVGRRL